jgi:cobalt-zinc-cadmium efflux system outer membrane protein
MKTMVRAQNFLLAMLLSGVIPARAQAPAVTSEAPRASSRFMDPVNGTSAAELAARALERNGELLAAREQVTAARGNVAQARLRANPSIEVGGLKQVAGMDNSIMFSGSLPLELFGRRERRVEVATSGLRMLEADRADRERKLRAAIESNFGDALAQLRNLQFAEDMLALNRKSLDLTEARVAKGATAPLDANILKVEVNRLDAFRVDLAAKVEVTLLELKSLAGMSAGEDLRLKGNLDAADIRMTEQDAIRQALESRPDLRSAKAAEREADAKLQQARVEARPDASFSAGYQRMSSGFNVNGFNAAGQLRPVEGAFHDITVGVALSLPLRNRNQGTIEAAVAQVHEARHRLEYAELVAAREVTAAFVTYQRAGESLDIYAHGVRELAAQNLDVIRKTYELGRTQLLDVIAEQRRYIDIETGYTEALLRHYQAAVAVRRAVGAGAQ